MEAESTKGNTLPQRLQAYDVSWDFVLLLQSSSTVPSVHDVSHIVHSLEIIWIKIIGHYMD